MFKSFLTFLTFFALPWIYFTSELSVPDIFIQYGAETTADEIQFQILCLVMSLLHENEIRSVSCQYNIEISSKYTVVRMLEFPDMIDRFSSNVWIFVTSSDLRSQLKDIQGNQNNIQTVYIGDSEMLVKRGHHISYEYQLALGLDNEEMMYVVEYMRYWDILRTCGNDENWKHLQELARILIPRNENYYLPKPACDVYNTSAVQQLFINTYIFQQVLSWTAPLKMARRHVNPDDRDTVSEHQDKKALLDRNALIAWNKGLNYGNLEVIATLSLRQKLFAMMCFFSVCFLLLKLMINKRITLASFYRLSRIKCVRIRRHLKVLYSNAK